MDIHLNNRKDFYKLYEVIHKSFPEGEVKIQIGNQFSFLEPLDIIILVKFVINAMQERVEVNISAPDQIINYLTSIGLLDFCKTNYEQPNTINFIPSYSAMPIRRVERETMSQYINLTQEFFNNLFEGKDLFMLNTCLAELINNVYDHAFSKIGAYVFCQYYPKIETVKLAVGDLGVGIPDSVNTYLIKKSERYKSSVDCLKWAIKENKTTATYPYNMGKGLNNLNSFVKSNFGKWIVLTDKAGLKGTRWGNNYFKNEIYNFKGTIIQIEIKINNLDAKKAVKIDFDWD